MLTKAEIKKIKNKTEIDGEDKIIESLSLLGDKSRFYIIKLLMSKKELCVSDLAHIIGISISAISHQMRLLEMGGLVKKERMGQTICYKIEEKHPLIKSLNKLFK